MEAPRKEALAREAVVAKGGFSKKGGSTGGSSEKGGGKGGGGKGGNGKGGNDKGGFSKKGGSTGGSSKKDGSTGGSSKKEGKQGGGKLSPVSSPISSPVSPPDEFPTGGKGSFCDTCGQKSFVNIELEGGSFFSEVIPASNGEKTGSTVAIYKEELTGTAITYDDYNSGEIASADITATVTGSCTIVNTNVTDIIPFAIDRCLLHCTICLMYKGEYCSDQECCPVNGYATLTGDVILDIQLDENGTISDTFEQFTDFFGVAAITGGSFDLAGYENGGLGTVEFLGDSDDVPYKLSLGVPFDDESACKFSNDAINQIYG